MKASTEAVAAAGRVRPVGPLLVLSSLPWNLCLVRSKRAPPIPNIRWKERLQTCWPARNHLETVCLRVGSSESEPLVLPSSPRIAPPDCIAHNKLSWAGFVRLQNKRQISRRVFIPIDFQHLDRQLVGQKCFGSMFSWHNIKLNHLFCFQLVLNFLPACVHVRNEQTEERTASCICSQKHLGCSRPSWFSLGRRRWNQKYRLPHQSSCPSS